MGFGTLAIIAAAGLIGPLLALRSGWNIPVVLGRTGRRDGARVRPASAGWMPPTRRSPFWPTSASRWSCSSPDPTSRSGIPQLRRGIRPGAAPGGRGRGDRGASSAPALAALFDTGHAALYAVLMASSSAALILPIVDSLRLTGPAVLQLLPQVADRRRRLHRGAAAGDRPGARRPGRARGRAR